MSDMQKQTNVKVENVYKTMQHSIRHTVNTIICYWPRGKGHLFSFFKDAVSIIIIIIIIIASGVGLSPLYCGRFWPIVPTPSVSVNITATP
jgi:hypothetical protein